MNCVEPMHLNRLNVSNFHLRFLTNHSTTHPTFLTNRYHGSSRKIRLPFKASRKKHLHTIANNLPRKNFLEMKDDWQALNCDRWGGHSQETIGSLSPSSSNPWLSHCAKFVFVGRKAKRAERESIISKAKEIYFLRHRRGINPLSMINKCDPSRVMLLCFRFDCLSGGLCFVEPISNKYRKVNS